MNSIPQILEIAIGPVILISGVGLLLLSMTNRLARAVDRTRHFAGEIREKSAGERGRLAGQLDLLFRRAKLIRAAIGLATLSVLMAALLIITLFLTTLFQWENASLISGLFIACLLALIASLLAFLLDVHWSLAALKLEIQHGNENATVEK